MMTRRLLESRLTPLFLLLFVALSGQAQDQPAETRPGAEQAAGRRPAEERPDELLLAEAAPPRGFRTVELGMELEQVKERLLQDPLYDYRGEPDISFLPQPPQTLIETSGSSYIQRAYFQFHDDRLYIMILSLDQDKLDYYMLYSTLSAKYGIPDSLDPTESVWQFEGLRLSLERPLNVKYIDTAVFERLNQEGRVQQDLWELSKDNFLEQF